MKKSPQAMLEEAIILPKVSYNSISVNKDPQCSTCCGKGYYSKLEIIIGYEDFGGDGFEEPPKIRFFRCPKCKSRKKIPKDIIL